MLEIDITGSARRDIANVLFFTEQEFGSRAKDRYEALIKSAIRDLAASPDRIGVLEHHEVAADCRSYHIVNSKKRSGRSTVKNPRHILLFRVDRENVLQVLGLLHDRMDAEERLGRMKLE